MHDLTIYGAVGISTFINKMVVLHFGVVVKSMRFG
jgi:hypothetical protein